MYKDWKDKGLQIVAFPCNQFGSQEPHDAKWIIDFLKKYDVDFPLTEKVSVTNKRQHPIYKWLREESSLKGADMQWNFEKFLLDGEGNIVKHYFTDVDPNGCKSDIEKLLA